MKVYTEVNYIWKDDKLVQTNSKSYDYEGEVEQCHIKRVFGMVIAHPHQYGWSDKATMYAGRAGLDKPGGSVKSQITAPVKEWSQKAEHAIWGNPMPGQDNTSTTNGTDDINEPDTKATLANRRNRSDEYSTANRRGVSKSMANINKGKKHSLLTQRKGGR
jgi:hypothetical protein